MSNIIFPITTSIRSPTCCKSISESDQSKCPSIVRYRLENHEHVTKLKTVAKDIQQQQRLKQRPNRNLIHRISFTTKGSDLSVRTNPVETLSSQEIKKLKLLLTAIFLNIFEEIPGKAHLSIRCGGQFDHIKFCLYSNDKTAKQDIESLIDFATKSSRLIDKQLLVRKEHASNKAVEKISKHTEIRKIELQNAVAKGRLLDHIYCLSSTQTLLKTKTEIVLAYLDTGQWKQKWGLEIPHCKVLPSANKVICLAITGNQKNASSSRLPRKTLMPNNAHPGIYLLNYEKVLEAASERPLNPQFDPIATNEGFCVLGQAKDIKHFNYQLSPTSYYDLDSSKTAQFFPLEDKVIVIEDTKLNVWDYTNQDKKKTYDFNVLDIEVVNLTFGLSKNQLIIGGLVADHNQNYWIMNIETMQVKQWQPQRDLLGPPLVVSNLNGEITIVTQTPVISDKLERSTICMLNMEGKCLWEYTDYKAIRYFTSDERGHTFVLYGPELFIYDQQKALKAFVQEPRYCIRCFDSNGENYHTIEFVDFPVVSPFAVVDGMLTFFAEGCLQSVSI